MAILEQEVLELKKEIQEGSARHRKTKLAHPKKRRNWTDLFSYLFVMALSFAILSLASFHRNLGASISDAINKFNWMVLVKGDSLQMDEVGRFLRQLPGVKEVTYTSSAEAFAKVQADPLYFNDLSSFKPEDLPASWRVAWNPNPLDFSLLEIWAEDARHLPSVLGVAFDPSAVLMIKGLRSAWYKAQMGLSLMAMALVILGTVLFGRFLFFTPLASFQGKKFAVCVVRDQVCWLVGGAIVFRALGGFAWPFWLGGVLIGALHATWKFVEQNT